jgi:FSR family fosmidomycin resistance protein-like MFS transporter
MNTFNLKVLLLLSLGHCVVDIYNGALFGALPFLKDKLDLSYTMAGMILIASNIASSVIQPFFGFISDKKEKPLLLPLGCLCAGLGFSLLAFPSQYAVVLLLVLISGLGVAAYHPEGFKTASYFTGERKATGLSFFAVGGNLGFAVGPFLAFYLITHYGIAFLPVMIVPALLFIALITVFWKTINVPNTAHAERIKDGTKRKTVKSAYINLSVLMSVIIMRSWAQVGLITYIPFYYKDYLKGNSMYAGQLVSVFLLSSVIATLLGAPLADRWGHKRFLVASLALSSLVLPLIFLAKGLYLFLVLGILGLVMLSSFSITVVMAQRLLPYNVGMASGLTVGFSIGAGGLGVTLLGIIADAYGVLAALKFIIIIPIIGCLLSMLVKYPRPHTE